MKREAVMLEFLPQEIRDGLASGRKREKMRAARLRVQLGDAAFPILRIWDGGFTLDAARAPHLTQGKCCSAKPEIPVGARRRQR